MVRNSKCLFELYIVKKRLLFSKSKASLIERLVLKGCITYLTHSRNHLPVERCWHINKELFYAWIVMLRWIAGCLALRKSGLECLIASYKETLLYYSGTMFSANDQTPTCRADQKSRSKIFSNKTLVGGLEAGKFSFAGVVRYSLFKSYNHYVSEGYGS